MGPYHADPAQPLTAEIDDLLILSEVCALVQPTVTGADGVFFLHTKKGNTTGRLQKEIGYHAPPSLAPSPPPAKRKQSTLLCRWGLGGAKSTRKTCLLLLRNALHHGMAEAWCHWGLGGVKNARKIGLPLHPL